MMLTRIIRKRLLPLFTLSCFTAATLFGQMNSGFFPPHIFVKNRILSQVNGKAISVIDVTKKLDLLFYRQFPQYASSVEARFQFYEINWKPVWNELVEKELILAEAAEHHIEITKGDVRQEMEMVFGSNIIANLDKAGLTYEEAWEMIKEELTIRRMLSIRVNSLAFNSVTPKDVRSAYEEHIKEHTRLNAWRYQVISIRGKDPSACEQAASDAYQLLETCPAEELEGRLKEASKIGKDITLTISNDYEHDENHVSEAYKTILCTLEPETFSSPIPQKSRTDQSTVFRIFYLKEMTPGGTIPYHEIENKLKDSLIEKMIEQESEKYIARLRQHFDIQNVDEYQMIPDDFQPFALY